jgi:hypothetical protein
MSEANSKYPVSHGDRVSDLILIHDDRIEYVEGEGDYTVRPIPPERLAQAMAERELIEKCLADQKAKGESTDQ